MIGSLIVLLGIILILFAIFIAYYSPDAMLGPGPAWIIVALAGIACFFIGGGLNMIQNWIMSFFST